MTWSINAKGTKSAVLETVKAASASVGEAEMVSFERAKAHAIAVVEAAADDSEASVSCSGHGTSQDGVPVASSESLSISTWKATPTS
jgi:hypothetical protein